MAKRKPVAAAPARAATPATDRGRDWRRLEPWIPEPTLSKPALELLLRAEKPLTLREVAEGLGVPPSHLTAVLPRLCVKRLARRWKVPITSPHNCYAGRTSTRLTWLYQAVETEV